MYDLGLGDLAQTPQDSCPEILIKFLATRNGRVERTTCCVIFRLLPNYPRGTSYVKMKNLSYLAVVM